MMQGSDIGIRDSRYFRKRILFSLMLPFIKYPHFRRDRDDRDSRDREGSIDYRRHTFTLDESAKKVMNVKGKLSRNYVFTKKKNKKLFRQDEREIYGTPMNRSTKRREFDELGRAPGERILYNDRRNNGDIR
ncbi:6370_t:CDS:2, partial [Cetraspora pellucida]